LCGHLAVTVNFTGSLLQQCLRQVFKDLEVGGRPSLRELGVFVTLDCILLLVVVRFPAVGSMLHRGVADLTPGRHVVDGLDLEGD
jgi:hypothetical protein